MRNEPRYLLNGSSFLFSKLQAKQYKKANQKSLPLDFQYLLEEEKLLESIIHRLLHGKEKYESIFMKFASDGHYKATIIMSKNENMLLKYESIANEGGEETRGGKEENELLHGKNMNEQTNGEGVNLNSRKPSIEIEENEEKEGANVDEKNLLSSGEK